MVLDILKHCTLCPRECSTDRTSGELGFCQSSFTVKAARAALHFWEEPCLSAKAGSGAVFFSSCTLKCVFCQNYHISTLKNGQEISIKRLSDIFLNLQKQEALNINLVTPTHFVPQIIEALDIAKNNGLSLPIIYNSSGYEKISTIQMLKGYIDIYLPDFKYYDDALALKYSNALNYRQYALAALQEMVKQVDKTSFDKNGVMTKGVMVRHMLLPTHLDDSKKVLDMLFAVFDNDIYYSLMSQYTPLPLFDKFAELQNKVKKKDYQVLVDHAISLGITNGFVQQKQAAKESFIPLFDNTGIN
ncbi:MAG: radical SAM protein [Chloroflexi bacterium]|nr:radical SAM protein [Chloroflexota bacterium]